MKFKNYLTSIDHVSIYPMISLFIFVAFFVAVTWYVFSKKKSELHESSMIPLNNNDLRDEKK